MATNANAYNTRLTDEALEKRFRQTFRAQGGAELVDDLYASGVIIPVVDFTAAAEGSSLRADLQSALDLTTNNARINTTSANTTIINNAGFWRIKYFVSLRNNAGVGQTAEIQITDGVTTRLLANLQFVAGLADETQVINDDFIVFLDSGHSVKVTTSTTFNAEITLSYRQLATKDGTLVQPAGFTSS